MLGASLVLRDAALVGIAATVAADGPLAGVLLLAALFTVAGRAHKPAQAGLVTQLARTPAELAAANVLWSSADHVAFLGGSVLAGALAQIWSLESAFAVCAVPFIGGRDGAGAAAARSPSGPAHAAGAAGLPGRPAHRRRRPGDAAADQRFGVAMLVQAMVDVLIVIAALELLRLGDGGPGWLSAAWAAGGLAGGAAAVALIARRRLATGMILGLVLAGLPLAASASSSSPAARSM